MCLHIFILLRKRHLLRQLTKKSEKVTAGIRRASFASEINKRPPPLSAISRIHTRAPSRKLHCIAEKSVGGARRLSLLPSWLIQVKGVAAVVVADALAIEKCTLKKRGRDRRVRDYRDRL